jgi:hypothetical protein
LEEGKKTKTRLWNWSFDENVECVSFLGIYSTNEANSNSSISRSSQEVLHLSLETWDWDSRWVFPFFFFKNETTWNIIQYLERDRNELVFRRRDEDTYWILNWIEIGEEWKSKCLRRWREKKEFWVWCVWWAYVNGITESDHEINPIMSLRKGSGKNPNQKIYTLTVSGSADWDMRSLLVH